LNILNNITIIIFTGQTGYQTYLLETLIDDLKELEGSISQSYTYFKVLLLFLLLVLSLVIKFSAPSQIKKNKHRLHVVYTKNITSWCFERMKYFWE